MLRPQDDIYVTLPSNVPGVPGNKPSNYKTVLATPLKLNGAWEVALLETHYPHQIPNFKATILVVIATETPQSDQPKPQPNLAQVSQSPMSKPYWEQPNPINLHVGRRTVMRSMVIGLQWRSPWVMRNS